MKISKLLLIIFMISFLLNPLLSQSYDRDKIISAWKKNGTPGNLTITYPKNGTLFPPEIASPTLEWDDTKQVADTWFIIVGIDGNKELFSVIRKEQKWKPAPDKWEMMKKNSVINDLRITILGIKSSGSDNNPVLSGAGITIRTSEDEVGGLIFFRSLPLPFGFARANLETVHWCLGDISSEEKAPIVLKNLPVCGNCHSFTLDGKTLAMDVDAMGDKGAYVITEIKKDTVVDHDQIITWSDFQQKTPTMGLLSQISPDGRYVISTLRDSEIFVALDDIEYSNFFFPIKGILVVYDRVTDTYRSLPGADDENYVQSNANWSPDGKYIYFTRAPAIHSHESGLAHSTTVEDKSKFYKLLDDFKTLKKRLCFDIYRIPFNKGKGGKAEPLPGASHNGMSNFFPRFSPDGKWLIFTKAENFMLLQPDSRLYIMPAEGGKPRRLKCNTSNMNSWHSWSPNSKWLVFSSKIRGPYTQLYLTHIDNDGNDTPPVLLENFRYKKRAANIPEFVKIKAGDMERIIPKFIKNDSYTTFRSGRLKAKTMNFKAAIELYSKALQENPGFYAAYIARGEAKIAINQFRSAIKDFDEALKINPRAFRAYCKRGEAKVKLKDYQGALADVNKSLQINNNFVDSYICRGDIKIKTGNPAAALKDLDKAIEHDSESLDAYNKRALAKMKMKNFQGMLKDLDRCIQLKPTSAFLYFERGFAKFQLKDLHGSLKDLNEAIKLNPKYADAYIRKGDAQFLLKDYSGAIGAFSKAIELQPKVGQHYYKRGLARILTGKKDAGCRDLHTARDLGVKDAADRIINRYCIK